MEDEAKEIAEKRYESLVKKRNPFLLRARAASEISIPGLMPREGFNQTETLIAPPSSLIARGVVNLASKITLSFLPPNASFFKFVISEVELEQAFNDSQGAVTRASVDETLSRQEDIVINAMESSSLRTPVYEQFEHLIVTGNILVHLTKARKLKLFPLDRYVVVRDDEGNLTEIVTKECVQIGVLPEKLREAIIKLEGSEEEKILQEDVDIYTHCIRTGKRWEVHQEAEGLIVPGSKGSYPEGKLPWLALRFEAISGEDYGRGMIEIHAGDIMSLHGNRKALIDGAAAMARVIPLINPNGSTKAQSINDAENGQVVSGRAEDITFAQVNKYADFQVPLKLEEKLTQELSHVFLLSSAVQRNAERVTLGEIRLMIQELNSSLGGTYAALAQDFQTPIVELFINNLSKAGKLLPSLQKERGRGVISLQITAGVQALGRDSDSARLQTSFQMLSPLGMQEIMANLHSDELIRRVLAANMVDNKGLVKTEQERQQEQQAAQEAQRRAELFDLLKTATPEAAKQIMPQLFPQQGEGQQPQQPQQPQQ